MDRADFKIGFSEENLGGWPCPRCLRGSLVADPKIKLKETSVDSKLAFEEVGEPDVLDISIAISLECSDSKCKERVICLANGNPEFIERWNDEYNEHLPDYVTIFRPIFFYPHLKIFNVIDEVPVSIRKHIYNSFQIFFCNPGSSLSNLRIALEETLNFLDVKKFITNKQKKRIRLSLHDRINCLGPKFNNIKNLCLAIKWHGNAGSHSQENITKDDVLDVYEIFEVILEKLFEKKTKNASSLAKRINKQKGIGRRKKN